MYACSTCAGVADCFSRGFCLLALACRCCFPPSCLPVLLARPCLLALLAPPGALQPSRFTFAVVAYGERRGIRCCACLQFVHIAAQHLAGFTCPLRFCRTVRCLAAVVLYLLSVLQSLRGATRFVCSLAARALESQLALVLVGFASLFLLAVVACPFLFAWRDRSCSQ